MTHASFAIMKNVLVMSSVEGLGEWKGLEQTLPSSPCGRTAVWGWAAHGGRGSEGGVPVAPEGWFGAVSVEGWLWLSFRGFQGRLRVWHRSLKAGSRPPWALLRPGSQAAQQAAGRWGRPPEG